MKFIDTHTHLYLEQFDEDRDQVVERALKQGVETMLLPNIDADSVAPLWKLVDAYPNHFYPMAGLHPSSVGEDYKIQLQRVEQDLNERKYIAVGEIGIDLYWDKTFEKQQKEALIFQFDLAIHHDLPVVIHSRDSFDEIIEVIDAFDNPDLKGVFHCFTGTESQAKMIIDRGFLLGIGGVYTFKNSDLRKELQNIDIENIVLETDAPYLTPAPYRGKRNESAYVYYVAQRMAEEYKKSMHEIAEITSANARKLFKI